MKDEGRCRPIRLAAAFILQPSAFILFLMSWLQQLDAGKFLLFTLVLTRTSGLVVTAPIYGTRDIPAQARVLLAVILAVLITPGQWHVAVDYPGSIFQYLVVLGSELLIGLCLGLGIVVLVASMHVAGELIGRTSGLMLSDVFDPSVDASVPLLGQLLALLATAVFVCIGGHRMVMTGLLDTFQTIPPGSALMPRSLMDAVLLLTSESLSLGIRASVPVVTALLLATVVLGLISRTLPQLNVLMLGFGLNTMLTFATLAVTLGAAVLAFQGQIEPTLERLLEAIHGGGG